jgi:ABC-type bacteriocin/lantibiotic exporter with double-glycine peptidase domain
MATSQHELAIEVQKLRFAYTAVDADEPVEQTLEDVDLNLPPGSRALLIGANGCAYLAVLS